MRILWCIPLLCAVCARADDSDAVRKTIARFNDPRERASVLAPGADLGGLSRFQGPELSQVYFEFKALQFVTPDVALVDTAGSQYGSVVVKRSLPALFVLKKQGGEWRVAIVRLTGRPCEPTAIGDARSPGSWPPNPRAGDRRP